jgi:hypothetical protein
MRFDDLEFAPRFEYGEMPQVAGVCGAEYALVHFAIHPSNWHED